MTITVKAYIDQAQERLASSGVENPELDVRLLLRHVLGWGDVKIFSNYNQLLSETEVTSLNTVIARRMAREPVSRIIGRRGFWNSEFKVSPHTLDPRPDSETLIELALKTVSPPPQRILDLGTGSACLLLTLLEEWPAAEGVGLDISAAAIETAQENAAALQLADRADFRASDWAHYNPAAPFDLVISNPPYITDEEMAALAPEVAQYDPVLALSGGVDGLDAYRAIVPLLQKFLKPGGWVFFEIGHAQASSVKSLLAEAGFTMIQSSTDLGESDRVVAAKRP